MIIIKAYEFYNRDIIQKTGKTALLQAVCDRRIDLVSLLIDAGACLEDRDNVSHDYPFCIVEG